MFGRSKKPKIDEKEERIKKLEERLDKKDVIIAELVATVHGHEKRHAKMNHRMVSVHVI